MASSKRSRYSYWNRAIVRWRASSLCGTIICRSNSREKALLRSKSFESMPDAQFVKLKINGIEIEAPKNSMAIEAAKLAGVDVPFFCYHPRLSMTDGGANCRMC